MKPLLVFTFLAFTIQVQSHSDEKRGFIENKGQFHENVRFQGNFGQYTVFLEQSRFTFLLEHAEDLKTRHDIVQGPREDQMDFSIRAHAYRVNFIGANNDAVMEKDAAHDHTLNFFLGSDESKWASGVRSYRKVKYSNLYKGIDLLAVVAKGNLKYDFIVQAGADPRQIELEFEGLKNIAVVEGDLLMTTSLGVVKELEPFVYQRQNGKLEQVTAQYVLHGNKIQFSFPEGYDSTRELVIDPVVIASTLSGTSGSSSNYGYGATYDLSGNIYTHAIAFGTQYPATVGAIQTNFGGGNSDIAISKYNPTGTDLIYATYLGGSDRDDPHSIVTNQFEELFVYGTTASDDYPITGGSFDETFNGEEGGGVFGGPAQDIVMTKISANGTDLLGSTFVGGSGVDGLNVTNSVNYGDSYRGEILLDLLGFPYVISQSTSINFPATISAFQNTLQGGQDAVVFKLTQDLTEMIWCTYLGSSDDDTGYGIRIAENGDAVVCGSTKGTGFPTTAGVFQENVASAPGILDAFVSRISADGSQLLRSTYVGTDQADQAFFIDLDNDEDVWIYGQSQGNWFVEGDGNYTNPNGKLFVTKLNSDLNGILVSSRIGPGQDLNSCAIPSAFLVDQCSRIYISGYLAISGFELTEDALYSEGDFVMCVWEENMSELAFSSYYGGNHVDGGTSRFDENGVIYQGVCNSGDFPTNPDAWSTTQSTPWDIGVFKIDFGLPGRSKASIVGLDSLAGCAPYEFQVESGFEADSYQWSWGDGSPDDFSSSATHVYSEAGDYTLQLVVQDSLSCNGFDTAETIISVTGYPEADFSFTVPDTSGDYSFMNQSLNYEEVSWILNSDTVSSSEMDLVTSFSPGVNEVCIYVENNCGSDLYCEIIDVTTGVDAGLLQDILVYPNPVGDRLNVKFNAPVTAIRLFNTLGKEIRISSDIDFNRIGVHTSHLAEGLYFLMVDYMGRREVIKFIKN